MTNVSFDLVAFDKASQNLLKVAEKFDKLAEKVDKLDRKRANVKVDADTLRADEALGRTGRKADELDRKRLSLKFDVGDVEAKLALVTAGLAAVGHLGPAAAAGMAAVPAVLGVLVQGAGALIVSLSGVGDGVKALEKAEAGLAKGGDAAMAAQAKLDAELGKLSPSARGLAEAIHGEVLPALRQIQAGVQSQALPRFQVALEHLLDLQPELTVGLSGTGKVLGDLAIRGAALMTSGPWRRDFATIMQSGNRSLDAFGTAGLSAANALRSLTVTADPLVERLANATARGAQLADQFIQDQRASGQLQQFMASAGTTLAQFGNTALQVVEGATKLTLALGPLGGGTLKVAGEIAGLIGNLSSAAPGLVQLAAAGLAAHTVLGKLSPLSEKLSTGLGKVGAVMDRTVNALSFGSIATQGVAAGFGDAAKASEAASSSSTRFSSALSKVGGALPVVGAAVIGLGIAYDSLVVSADDAARALLQGGAAAEQVTQKLQSQNHTISKWLEYIPVAGSYLSALNDKYKFLAPTLDDATRAAKDQYDAMTPLQQAQVDATQAAADYNQKVKQFTADSPQAQAAAQAWNQAVDRVKEEQQNAALATDQHTAAILQQQTTMLDGVGKDLAFRQSLIAVEQAQKGLTEAVQQHKAGSLEARQAGLQYEQALYQEIQALGANVQAQNTAKGSAEANRLAVQAQKDEIFRLAGAAGGAAPPALHAMASSLSDADLRARGATISVNNLGQRVVTLPNGKVIVLDANTAPAQGALQSLISRYNGRTITINTVINQTRNIHDILYGPGRALGSIDVPGFASGAIAAMAAGGTGVRSIPSIATVVPPNTPRLIGDRMRDNESFIPWDGSARSLAILQKTAQAMGYALAPLTQSGAVAGVAGGAVRAVASKAAMIAGRPAQIEIRSGGSRLDDLLVELLRKAIKDQGGGNVQAYLGR